MARPGSSPSPPPRRLWLLPLAGALLGVLLSLLLGPRAPTLGDPVGDPALAREAAQVLGDPVGYGAVSVLRLRDGESAWAGFAGPGQAITPHTRFELGSVTKTFNGLLLADAVERGEVGLEDRLDRHLPELAGTPAGTVTLAELASHRSGLPAMASESWAQTIPEDLAGTELSIFQASLPELLDASRDLEPTGRGAFAYSNLGLCLLGHALARAGGTPDWETYVTTRLLIPLGMDDTRFISPGDRDPDLTRPRLAGGRAVEPWTGSGYAPAGAGTSTTAADMARYAQAILDGTAPGVGALTPRWDTRGLGAANSRIGLTWVVSGPDGEEIAWHNGGTGGTRTMLAISPRTGTAVVILNSSRIDVTGAGIRLAGADAGGPPPLWASLSERDFYPIPAAVLMLVLVGGSWRGRNRLGLIARGTWGLAGLLLLWLAGPWHLVPGWVFGLMAGAVAGALVVVGIRWGPLPLRPRRFLWLSVPVLALGAGFGATMVGLTVRALQIG